jgi:hypothetical protein
MRRSLETPKPRFLPPNARGIEAHLEKGGRFAAGDMGYRKKLHAFEKYARLFVGYYQPSFYPIGSRQVDRL